jgi:hypothetical protein
MSKETYIAGKIPHVDEFLKVPDATVIVDNREKNGCSSSEFSALAGRIAAAQPDSKIKYWISIES